jgi:hypothetical protein
MFIITKRQHIELYLIEQAYMSRINKPEETKMVTLSISAKRYSVVNTKPPFGTYYEIKAVGLLYKLA